MHLLKSPLLTFILSFLFFFLIITSTTNPYHVKQQEILSSLPLPVEIIYKFPSGTWVENIAIRSNGLILAAILFAPEIYQVDPKTRTASLVAKIPAASGIIDIVEIEEDVFYVAACNFSDTSITPTAGNFSVWRLDVNTFEPENTLAEVEKIVDIPQAKFLNGATLLSRNDGTLLFADSVLGSVFRVKTRSKEVNVVITDPLFGVTSTSSLKEGVNGLKLGTKGNLLFTNTNQNLLGEISINSDGTPRDKGQVLSSGIVLPDDFAVGPPTLGFFATQNGLDQLSFVPSGGGKATVVVGAKDQPGLKGPTSAAIGKGNGKLGRGSLYVGTNGGVANYLSGSVTARGTISRIDIEKFY